MAYYERLALKIKNQILQGIWAAGDKLPSVREMAQQEQLNPNTVAKAYRQLEKDGVIEVQPGKGTFIKAMTATTVDQQKPLWQQLSRWLINAEVAGITRVQIDDFLNTRYSPAKEDSKQ
ncbi:GntR family transcriptional regulator [Schleiferilactobacillus perolens]|uniref:HTH gntR-type domain-containing protein n=1 Tax=Schleiferilactobacillus perolens DSM 12744 TaxID=1423792 RepID=A0A0R1N1V4_9LACO|nr:hypothetical protein FD09_GL001463 [Schleiferilactobacillus perolens DSM 12744]